MSIMDEIDEKQEQLNECRNRAKRIADEAKTLREILSKLEHDVIGSGHSDVVRMAHKLKPAGPSGDAA